MTYPLLAETCLTRLSLGREPYPPDEVAPSGKNVILVWRGLRQHYPSRRHGVEVIVYSAYTRDTMAQY